jgi:hypothetical protein
MASTRTFWRIGAAAAMAVVLSIVTWGAVHADTSDSTYGAGGYGICYYGTCTITLSSGSAASVNVLPTAGGACTVQSNTASVLTDNANGYSLSMTTNTTNNNMTGSTSTIGASPGTAAAPVLLTANTWGWRVDGWSGFGAGPTTTLSNGSIPSVTFAGVPANNQSAAQLALTAAPANPAGDTTVWYGVCANASKPSGTYTATVTYTAVTN